jgi:NTP pyrophosphatase (non-canonical NTP hydrolase)
MGKRRKLEQEEAPARELLPVATTTAPDAEVPPPAIAPLKPTAAYDTYWRFAVERQRIFFRRLEGCPPPWTEDSVLLANKFTNAYRASDRVSQYLIRRVIYRDDLPNVLAEVVFRILLFKVFNRIETWELLENAVGQVTHAEYSFKRYDQILNRALTRGDSIYSAAYIMPSASSLGHKRKHKNHLALIERMMAAELPARLADAGSMQKAFDLILAYPSIGAFLAYQYVTDINYSTVTNFTEMEFVTPGPGAIDGIKKCFSDTDGRTDAYVIRFMAERQEVEFARLGLEFQTLWGRRLQLIDCQNLFCEVSKYARVRHPEIASVSGRTQIKQKFRPHPDPISYMYPPKWGINDAVARHLVRPSAQTGLFATTQEESMNLREYQERANNTDYKPGTDDKPRMIALAGLAGEVGELLSEYKKYLLHGESHKLFKERLAEEIGDLLWYVANAATKFNLDLEQVAVQNLAKCQGRWGKPPAREPFDAQAPEGQRFPRRFLIDFATTHDKHENPFVRVYYENKPFGDELDDNSPRKDGYAYHDALHLAFAAILGWSPLTRKMLGAKRRDGNQYDGVERVEDGGRAIATEEGLSAMIFAYARDYNFLEGKNSVSTELLRMVKNMTAHLEVSVCTPGEWEHAIVEGFKVWRQIRKMKAGTLIVNLDERSVTIKD